MSLADSTAMRDFTANMRLVREFGNHAIEMRPTWSRIDALHAKCDARTITSAEACELLELERNQA